MALAGEARSLLASDVMITGNRPWTEKVLETLRTVARRTADGFVVNGRKRWITNSVVAGWVSILCRDGIDGDRAERIRGAAPEQPYMEGRTHPQDSYSGRPGWIRGLPPNPAMDCILARGLHPGVRARRVAVGAQRVRTGGEELVQRRDVVGHERGLVGAERRQEAVGHGAGHAKSDFRMVACTPFTTSGGSMRRRSIASSTPCAGAPAGN